MDLIVRALSIRKRNRAVQSQVREPNGAWLTGHTVTRSSEYVKGLRDKTEVNYANRITGHSRQ
jgi:hypothetical protein